MESDTTIRVYTRERDWLQARQRKIGFERNKFPTMADVVRELVEYVRGQESAGEGT